MPIVADAAVAVRGDLSKFKKDMAAGFGGAERQAQTFSQKLTGFLNPKNLAGGLIAGVAGSQIISLLSDATNAAAEFQDSVSATGVIFGDDLIPQVEAWAESAHESFGASKQAAIAAANQFAVFGKSAGLAGQELVDFSTEMVQLGGDLASFFGGSTEEAITAVGAALRGESEPIRRYGVLLDDATLRQKAFEMGLISTTSNALTPQQKVLAAHAEIMEQTADAQGDFERTSDGMANQQRALAAQLENVNIELGEKLMPVMVELVTWVSTDGIPILRGLVDTLDEVALVAGEITDAWGGPLDDVFGGFADDTQRAGEIFEEMGVKAGEAAPLLEHFGGDIGRVRNELERWVEEGLSFDEGMAQLMDGITILPENIKNATAGIESAVTTNLSGVPGAISGPFDTGTDDAVKEVESMFSRIASEIAARESQLREAGGNAVDAWLDPQMTGFEISAIESELASKELRDNLSSKDPEIRRDAEMRRVSLTAELISLKNEQATQGTETAQIAHTKALLTSKFMESGLKSKDKEIRNLFKQWKLEAETHLSTLEKNAYGYGHNTAAELARGMTVGKGLVVDAARELAQAGAAPITINSEPPDKKSAFYGITKWGGNIVKTIADGIYDELGTGQRAAVALSGVFGQPIGTAALSGVQVGASGSGSGVTYQLVVNGVPRTFNSKTEFIDALDDLSSFNDGRLS